MKATIFGGEGDLAGREAVAETAQHGSWLRHLIAGIRKSAEERRLREHLAGLDDALLRDIGIAEDEIVRIRGRERFLPRAWDAGRIGQ